MPTTLVKEPLGINCVFSDGRRAQHRLDDLPNLGLARDLAAGLVNLIHPHGTADSPGTLAFYVQALRAMVQALADAGFTGGAGDLRWGQLAEFWMGCSVAGEAMTRSLLEGFAEDGGVLRDGVLELAAGRHFNVQRYRRPLPPYPEAEWARLTEVCRVQVDDSYAAHRQVLVDAARAAHPGVGGWEPANLRWLLARIGPVSIHDFGAHLGVTSTVVHRRGGFHDAVRAAFPYLDVLIAYRLLFGIYSGIVPDGISDLVVDDIDWAGDSTILLPYVKRRTTAESLNLPRPAVRLLEQWLAHSALMRGFVPPDERGKLWLGLSQPGKALRVQTISRDAVHAWVRRHGLLIGHDGLPMKLHRSRIRTTHYAMRDKSSWSGSARATIDPNHTPAVEGDHYLTAATPAQQHAVESIVEDAQHDMLRRAHRPR